MIGFIAGAGIVVRNSIILVDFIEQRLREGMPLEEAVVDAGAVRFRPMVLTAAAVVVGAAVILFDPIFRGLAISLMAGEVASLMLSRTTVPIVDYMMRCREQHLRSSASLGDMAGTKPWLVIAALLALAVGCIDPLTLQPTTNPSVATRPYVRYGENAVGRAPEPVLGRDLSVAAGEARWIECGTVDTCGTLERRRPADELVAVETVGETTNDGRSVPVLRLSLKARPAHVVPAEVTVPRY